MKPIENRELFVPISTTNSAMLIYEDLKDKIMSGKLPSGSKLPSEKRLADEYNKSAPIIREALCMLEKDGLVSISQGDCTTVTNISLDILIRPFFNLLMMEHTHINDIVSYQKACNAGFIQWVSTSISDEQLDTLIKKCRALRSKHTSESEAVALCCDIYSNYFKVSSSQLINIVTKLFLMITEPHIYAGLHGSDGCSVITAAQLIEPLTQMVTATASHDLKAAQEAGAEFLSQIELCSNLPVDVYETTSRSAKFSGRKVSQSVYEQLRDNILSGKLPVGTKLPGERELSELYQRSRAPIREALRMLESDGLIKKSAGRKGTIVCELSTTMIEQRLMQVLESGIISDRELVEYRKINDPIYGSWAAKHCTEEMSFALDRIVKSSADNMSFQEFFDIDRQLHNTIALLSGNKEAYLLTKVLMNVSYNRRLQVIKTFTPETYNFYYKNVVQQHRTLVKLISCNDEKSASEFMLYHAKSFEDLL